MLKRIAPIGVVSFVFLMAGTAACQASRESLPDAPSAQDAIQPPSFEVMAKEGAVIPFEETRTRRQREFIPGDISTKQPDTIFRKYLSPSPSSLRPVISGPLASASVMNRATHAASGILVTRDGSGNARLNTSYVLRTLASVVKDTASTPYWRRHSADPFSDFGSTVGSDAGMKVWHEFSPGLQQLMKSHALKFVSRIEERIGQS